MLFGQQPRALETDPRAAKARLLYKKQSLSQSGNKQRILFFFYLYNISHITVWRSAADDNENVISLGT